MAQTNSRNYVVPRKLQNKQLQQLDSWEKQDPQADPIPETHPVLNAFLLRAHLLLLYTRNSNNWAMGSRCPVETYKWETQGFKGGTHLPLFCCSFKTSQPKQPIEYKISSDLLFQGIRVYHGGEGCPQEQETERNGSEVRLYTLKFHSLVMFL